MSKKTYYYLYKITNLLNNKIYIGCHVTTNLDDGYFGSGKYLKKAILKYGKENFEMQILNFYNSREEMYSAENKIVNKDFIKRRNTYNVALGGKGGFRGYSPETSKKMSEANKGKVTALDLYENKTVKIDKAVFDSNKDRYVGATKGRCVVLDENGDTVMVDQKTAREKKYVGVTKGKAVVKDKDGNVLVVDCNDNKLLSGELKGITAGCKQTPESNAKRSVAEKGKKRPQKYITCEFCGTSVNLINYIRWHKDKSCLKRHAIQDIV